VSVKTHKHGEQHYGNQDSMASFVTRLWAGQSAVQFIVGTRDLYLLKNVQTSSGLCPPSYSMGLKDSFSQYSIQSVNKFFSQWLWRILPSLFVTDDSCILWEWWEQKLKLVWNKTIIILLDLRDVYWWENQEMTQWGISCILHLI
jgi:hypothetical protein